MRYKKYKGNDKYHFRVYRTSVFHPFIVVMVDETIDKNGRVLISGYMMTTSLTRVIDKPGSYKRLKKNPNPNDNKISFVNKFRISNIPANKFSKPYTSWHLSKEDELIIDSFERNYQNKKD